MPTLIIDQAWHLIPRIHESVDLSPPSLILQVTHQSCTYLFAEFLAFIYCWNYPIFNRYILFHRNTLFKLLVFDVPIDERKQFILLVVSNVFVYDLRVNQLIYASSVSQPVQPGLEHNNICCHGEHPTNETVYSTIGRHPLT